MRLQQLLIKVFEESKLRILLFVDLIKRRLDTTIALIAVVISIYVIFRDKTKDEADSKATLENQRRDSLRYIRQFKLANQLQAEQLKSQKSQSDSVVAELNRIKILSYQSDQNLRQQIIVLNKQIELTDRQLKLSLAKVDDDKEAGQPQLFISEIQAFRDYRTSYRTSSLSITVKNTGVRTALNLRYKSIVIYHLQRDSIFKGKNSKSLPSGQEWYDKVTIGTPEKDPEVFSIYQHMLPASAYDQNIYFVILLSYSDTKTGYKILPYYFRNDNMYPHECSATEIARINKYFRLHKIDLNAISRNNYRS